MKKYLFLSLLFFTISTYADSFAQDGVTIKIKTSDGKTKEVDIYRDISEECKYNFKFSPQMLWGKAFADPKVPNECKVTIVSSAGKISPMKIAKDVETYGELEVLKFIQKMQKNSDMLFIDSRTSNWYEFQTIPSAINIPYIYFLKADNFKDEFIESLQKLGVKKDNKGYNFTKAKTLLLFCNGPWCGQSPIMIKKLLEIGYPAKKIKWYRGGMHSWNSLNMITTKDKEYK